MFTSAKDIMKIIWNGLREIKKNCSDYYEKDARKIYEETLNGVNCPVRSRRKSGKNVWSGTDGRRCVWNGRSRWSVF